MTGSASCGTEKPRWGPTHATTCFETRYAMPAAASATAGASGAR